MNDIESGTVLAPTQIDMSEKDGNAIIGGSYGIYRLIWEDANERKQYICKEDEFKLQIHMNPSAKTAMFKLSTKVTIRYERRKMLKKRVYLYIRPELIKGITIQITPDELKGSAASAKHYSLHFSLTKQPDSHHSFPCGDYDKVIESLTHNYHALLAARSYFQYTRLWTGCILLNVNVTDSWYMYLQDLGPHRRPIRQLGLRA